MAIDLTCSCGKILQMADHAAGAVGQCPACGRIVPMPASIGAASQAVTADPGRPVLPAMPGDTAVAEGSPPPSSPAALAALDDWGEIARPPYALWSPRAMGWVAFLCGPVGPLLMMAVNYARLGKRSAACATVGFCVLLSAVIAFGLALPDNGPGGFTVGVPMFFIVWGAARMLQGKPYDAHVRAGGTAASGWSAAGWGVLGIVLFLGACAGADVACELIPGIGLGRRIDFGGGQEIYHTRGATEVDARALGQALRQAGFFDGRNPAAVQVAREDDRMIVAFIVQPWVLHDIQIQQQFRIIGDQASAQAFAGRRVEVWLCDDSFRPKKKMP